MGAKQSNRTALQASMGIGEKPPQGELFPEWYKGVDTGWKQPLTSIPARPPDGQQSFTLEKED